jgi:hypothetical protein
LFASCCRNQFGSLYKLQGEQTGSTSCAFSKHLKLFSESSTCFRAAMTSSCKCSLGVGRRHASMSSTRLSSFRRGRPPLLAHALHGGRATRRFRPSRLREANSVLREGRLAPVRRPHAADAVPWRRRVEQCSRVAALPRNVHDYECRGWERRPNNSISQCQRCPVSFRLQEEQRFGYLAAGAHGPGHLAGVQDLARQNKAQDHIGRRVQGEIDGQRGCCVWSGAPFSLLG